MGVRRAEYRVHPLPCFFLREGEEDDEVVEVEGEGEVEVEGEGEVEDACVRSQTTPSFTT